MGQVAFSAGLEYGGRRIPIQYVYDTRIAIISKKGRIYLNIPKAIYEACLTDLKQSAYLHDKYIASGKVEVAFSSIDEETLSIILNAAIKLATRYKSTAET